MNVPDELRYSTDHEWVRVEGGRVRVGITDYAQDALGDVVFVELPEVGAAVGAGDSVQRGRVDQVGVRRLRPGRRHGRRGQRPTSTTAPSDSTTTPTARAGSA